MKSISTLAAVLGASRFFVLDEYPPSPRRFSARDPLPTVGPRAPVHTPDDDSPVIDTTPKSKRAKRRERARTRNK